MQWREHRACVPGLNAVEDVICESLLQSSTQVLSITPIVTIPCNIVFMGKYSLPFNNWIYSVVSRNAFVSKQSWAKSNTTWPWDKKHCGKRQELAQHVFKEEERENCPKLCCSSRPSEEKSWYWISPVKQKKTGCTCVCLFIYLY